MIVHVRFAPKATVADQNVIRCFVPGPDSCTAANLVPSAGLSLRSLGSKHFTALSKLSFEPRGILQQTPRDQLEKVEPKLGILKKKLLNLAIADLEHYPCVDAFERLRTAVFGCEQGKLANHMRAHNLDTSLPEPEMAGQHDKHITGDLTLVEHNLTGSYMSRRRKRLEPVHIGISLRCLALALSAAASREGVGCSMAEE
jgi:hypothetical protein